MKYLKEYNYFDDNRLFEPIYDSEFDWYYGSVIDPPKNIENIILNSEDLRGLYSKIEYHPEISFDTLKCFQILLEFDYDYKYRTKRYYQIHLDTFYTSDEYFICAIKVFRNDRSNDFTYLDYDDYDAYYTYKCDSIEGLIDLIKNLKNLL